MVDIISIRLQTSIFVQCLPSLSTHLFMKLSSTVFRRRKLTIAALLLLGLISLLAIWSRGPVGPASVTSKELAEHLSTSAEIINAEFQGPREVATDTLSVSFALALKHRIKSVYSPERDRTEEFVYKEKSTGRSIRCLARYRGDHLLAIALENNAPQNLRVALEKNLPDYMINSF